LECAQINRVQATQLNAGADAGQVDGAHTGAP
jgi:hypothetical protein